MNSRLLDRIVGNSVRLAAFASGLAMLWLMVLTIGAVIMRYFFNAPILGAQDLSQVSLVLVVFPAMAYCGWTGGHVALDLISSLIKPTALRWTEAIIQAICAALFVFITWQTWHRALDAVKYGTATNLIEIPYAPFYFVVALSSGLYAVVLFIQAIKSGCGSESALKQ